MIAIFENQPNCSAQAGAAFFHAAPLFIRAGNLRRPAGKPLAILFNDRCEFAANVPSMFLIAKLGYFTIASGLLRSVRNVGTAASRLRV